MDKLYVYEKFLREEGPFRMDPQKAKSGHSLGQMTALVSATLEADSASPQRLVEVCGPPAGDEESTDSGDSAVAGTSEQFASLFALMARSQGISSRVVVGFRLGTPVADGVVEVKGKDTLAWPEVFFERAGWVPFDPTPAGDEEVKDEDFTFPEDDQGQSPQAGGDQAGETPSPSHKRGDGEKGSLQRVPWSLVGLISLGTMIVVPGPTILALKWRRSRRRRSINTPRGRILGAWSESLERMDERHVGLDSSMTATTVAQICEDRLGPRASELLEYLASMVNAALYRRGEIAIQQADQAWMIHQRFLATIRSGEPFFMRLRARLSLRPFLRRKTGPRDDGASARSGDIDHGNGPELSSVP